MKLLIFKILVLFSRQKKILEERGGSQVICVELHIHVQSSSLCLLCSQAVSDKSSSSSVSPDFRQRQRTLFQVTSLPVNVSPDTDRDRGLSSRSLPVSVSPDTDRGRPVAGDLYRATQKCRDPGQLNITFHLPDSWTSSEPLHLISSYFLSSQPIKGHEMCPRVTLKFQPNFDHTIKKMSWTGGI